MNGARNKLYDIYIYASLGAWPSTHSLSHKIYAPSYQDGISLTGSALLKPVYRGTIKSFDARFPKSQQLLYTYIESVCARQIEGEERGGEISKN